MTLDVILAWLVILLLLTAFSVLLMPEPKKSKKAMLTREGESVMGQHIKAHRPRRTIHTIVNSMAGEAAPSQVMLVPNLLQREEIPDVSFWQGVINWAKMASKTRKIIIRAGQNKWVDICFKVNYAAAKLFGLLRGVYFFYDGRVSPSEQLETLKEALNGEAPELGIWVDWEKNFGGAHEGLRNVVAFMEIIERAFPGVEVGMYTGYWFFRENSNPIWNAAQYTYLAARRLWLAFYAALHNVLIPAPWGRMKYWQKGTPAVGLEWGVSTKELDMNEDMDSDPDPIPPPQPEPEPEEPMTITFTGKVKDTATLGVNVRTSVGLTAPKIATLGAGTEFTATGSKVPRDGYDWLLISALVAPAVRVNGWLALTSNIEYAPVAPPADPQPSAVGRVVISIDAKIYDAAGRLTGSKVVEIDEPLEGVE